MGEEAKLPISQDDLDALRDPKGQKGVQWRMQKLAAIRRLVRDGKTRAWVIWFLRTRTGLTLPTARSLVDDAFLEEPKGEAEDGRLWSYLRRPKAKSDNSSRKMRGVGETRMSKALTGDVPRERIGKDAAAGKKHSTSSKSERTKR